MSIVLLQISGVTVISGVVFLTLAVVLYLVAKAVMRWLDNYRDQNNNQNG
jgi:membrane protein implicated in regulation of membrane protease activity